MSTFIIFIANNSEWCILKYDCVLQWKKILFEESADANETRIELSTNFQQKCREFFSKPSKHRSIKKQGVNHRWATKPHCFIHKSLVKLYSSRKFFNVNHIDSHSYLYCMKNMSGSIHIVWHQFVRHKPRNNSQITIPFEDWAYDCRWKWLSLSLSNTIFCSKSENFINWIKNGVVSNESFTVWKSNKLYFYCATEIEWNLMKIKFKINKRLSFSFPSQFIFHLNYYLV